MIDHPRIRRESMRWTILLTLKNARPVGAGESLVLQTVQSLEHDTSAKEIRVEMAYLEKRDLITIERAPHGPWHAELTRYGIDITEYTIDCEPGIARPTNYWAG